MASSNDLPDTLSSHIDSANNHGPLIFSVAWCLAAASVMSASTRLAMRRALTGRLGWDDYLIIVSTILSLAQTTALTVATSNGEGKHQSSLTESQLETLEKAVYAGNILFILSLAFGRISVGELIRSLTPVWHHQGIIYGTMAFITLWSLVSTMVFSFQCRLPDPWRYINGTCINQTAFLTYIDVMNLVSDILLIAVPIYVLIPLKLQRGKKSAVIMCFSFRISVIGAVIPNLYFIYRFKGGEDSTFREWPQIVAAQAIQSLNIVTACIPYLKPFYKGLQSGMLGIDDLRRRQVGSIDMYGFSGGSSGPSGKDGTERSWGKSGSNRYGNTAVALSNLSTAPKRNSDTGSQSSQTNIIKKTQTFSVVTHADAGNMESYLNDRILGCD